MVQNSYVETVGEQVLQVSDAPPTTCTKLRLEDERPENLGITKILSEAITDRVVPLK